MVFVVVGTHTKRVIDEFAWEQVLTFWFFNVTHKKTVQIWGDLPKCANRCVTFPYHNIFRPKYKKNYKYQVWPNVDL